jgi:hypothetical protein
MLQDCHSDDWSKHQPANEVAMRYATPVSDEASSALACKQAPEYQQFLTVGDLLSLYSSFLAPQAK